MLMEEDLRQAIRQVDRYGILLAALCLPAFLLIGLVIGLRGWIDPVLGKYGVANSADWLVGGIGLYMLLAVFACMARALQVQSRFPNRCPACQTELGQRLRTLLLTRTCPACAKHIVMGGKVRRLEVVRRYQKCKHDRGVMIMLSIFGAMFPILASGMIAHEWWTYSEQGRQFLMAPVIGILSFTFAFFGFANSGRCWFLVEMAAAAAVGVVGGWLYWFY